MAGTATRKFDETTFDSGTQTGVALVDFYADWCGPCRAIAPTIDKLASEYEGRATVAKVDVDAAPGVAQRFGVSSIPTLVVLKDGQVHQKFVGLQGEAALRQAIEQALGT